MPCKHVVATIWDMALDDKNVGIPETWVHPCYWLTTWKKMYEFKVNPINGRDGWPISTCPLTLIPPKHHTQIGRPKKKRKKSQSEISENIVQGGKLSRAGISSKCTKCGTFGHNRRTCTGPAATSGSGAAASGSGVAKKPRRSKKSKTVSSVKEGGTQGAAGVVIGGQAGTNGAASGSQAGKGGNKGKEKVME